MTVTPIASESTPVSSDVLNAENFAVRQGLFGLHDNPNPDRGTAESTPDAPADKQTEGEGERQLSIREQIAERAKARREAERAGIAPEDLTTNEMGEFVPPFVKQQAAEDADAAVKAAADKAAAAEAEQNKTYTLKVRGNDVPVASRAELLKLAEVDEEDAGTFTDAALIKLAQKQMAASAILDEAKQHAKSARQAAREDDTDDTLSDQEKAAKDRDERANDRPAADQGPKADWHKEAIEKIQFGDPEEAAAAFRDAIAKGVNEVLTKNQVSERVTTVETMIDRAAKDFEEANKDLFEDPDIADFVYNKALIAEFKRDLIAGGADPSKVDSVLGDSVATAMPAYIAVAASGRMKIRQPAEMLAAAEKAVRTKMNRPKPEGATPEPRRDRLQEKRNLQPQPSRASVPQTADTPKNGQSPEARSSVVAKMRKARGQAA